MVFDIRSMLVAIGGAVLLLFLFGLVAKKGLVK
jgi:hypothetical protein